MPEAMAAAKASNGGKNKGGAYVDRDKPAQIRFSNISAAKGELDVLTGWVQLSLQVHKTTSRPQTPGPPWSRRAGLGWAGQSGLARSVPG